MLGNPNPDKLHPLSKHAREKLEDMHRRGYLMTLDINAGVQERFRRGGLAEYIDVPNPYKTKTARARAMQITDAGRRELGVAG